MKKKIVHIVESFGSGVLSYLSDLVSGLADDYDITILYGERQQTPKNINDYFPSNVKLIKINNFTRNINPVKDIKATLEIRDLVKKIDPDIIHLHSSKAGVLGRLISYRKNQKVFYTPHGYAFLNESDGKIKHFIYYGAEKILGFRNVETIACSKSEYLSSLKVTKHSKYINNSIDTHKLDTFFSDDSNTQDVIFTVGRIDEQKNPLLFNKIAESLPDMKFIWFGDGKQRPLLTASNVQVTGWLSRSELLQETQNYKYFILTSRWEGLPISLLEAMYFKKVCFVTNVAGNKDTIIDKVDGYCFETAKQFLDDFKSKDDSLGLAAHKKVQKEFSRERMLGEYIETYEKHDDD